MKFKIMYVKNIFVFKIIRFDIIFILIYIILIFLLFLVFVDIIFLILGYVVDGLNLKKDLVFLLKIVIKIVLWNNFIDLEFGIDNYVVLIYINNVRVKMFNFINYIYLIDNFVSM